MVVGQLALTVGFLALVALCLLRLGRGGRLPAGCFALAALGTAQLTAFRTICNRSDVGWCAPLPRSAYPSQQWAHGIGTGIAFAALLLAGLAVGRATWSVPGLRDVALVAICAIAVSLPCVVWFLLNAETVWHGLAEKIFLCALAAFASYTGWRLGTAPAPT
jgi:hypothetical protein